MHGRNNSLVDQQSVDESAAGNRLHQLAPNAIGGKGVTYEERVRIENQILNDEEHERVIEKRRLCKLMFHISID